MCDRMIKKGGSFFAIFLLLILTSGCETVGAIRAGDIKMSDVVHMAKARTADTGKTGEIEEENIVLKKIKEIDAWMRKNLW